MAKQPSFPSDFRAIKSLERKYKGKTTRPVDQSKMRVKVNPTARKQPEVKTVPMASPLSVLRTLGGVVANAPQGAYDIATILGPAAVDYFRRSSPSDVVEDVKGGLSSYANYFRENPGEAVTDLIPLAGDAKAFGEMIREASLAREAGDEELARAIESYTLPVVAAGLIPEVGGAVGAAARKLRGAKAAPLAVKNEVKALPAPQKTLALPKPFTVPVVPADKTAERVMPTLNVSDRGGQMRDYARYTEMVPISWLEQLEGNELRYGGDRLRALSEDIATRGIANPLILSVGKENSSAILGEGNHRLAAARMAGMTHVPARVSVGDEVGSSFAGRSDLVPLAGKYFPSQAKPSDVFASLQEGSDPGLSYLRVRDPEPMGPELQALLDEFAQFEAERLFRELETKKSPWRPRS